MSEPARLGARLFTLDEAEALLPELSKRLQRFQTDYERLEEAKRELAVLRLVSASGGDEANPDSSELDRKESLVAELLEKLHKQRRSILGTGAVVKSMQDGLVDFFAVKDSHVVFLCWKLGEDGIRAWHTLEGGFSGRMPIETFIGELDTGPTE